MTTNIMQTYSRNAAIEAVMNTTGLSRKRAMNALKELEKSGLLAFSINGTMVVKGIQHG
ncbi:hypothetical protein STRDD10_00428 [Streptococcus sp. DD10]|uniref:hypothetical protein n=1 Tax=Streptococcus sp. DD10 TaxID=1777878 RepID=UPI00079A5BCB|nr:hypothetical protein [Streptococcus sp. DD10]KXT75154.1 hypothetical protein STRDD10_00428 [Streptococcus sp. DD10]